MPYIEPAARDALDRGAIPIGPGELNYLLTNACVDYLYAHGLTYQSINDVLGALQGASHEFYRRVAAPYEDDAIVKNGDAYPQGFTKGRPNKDVRNDLYK